MAICQLRAEICYKKERSHILLPSVFRQDARRRSLLQRYAGRSTCCADPSMMQKADRCFSAALAAQVALARLTQRGADFCGSYGAAAAHLLRSQVAIYSLIFVSSELSADPLLQYRGTCRSSGALNNYKASSRAALRSAHLVQGGHGVFVLHVARSPTLSYGRVCQTKNMAFC